MEHFHMESELNRVFCDGGSGGVGKMNIGLAESVEDLGEALS
jgi:NADPH:quinone reductase-like Zn-dependent oxidoreductase